MEPSPSPRPFSAAAAASRCEAVASRIVATCADMDETLRAGDDDANARPYHPHLALLADEMRTFGAAADGLTAAVPLAAVIAPALQAALARSLDEAETAWAVADKQLRRLRDLDACACSPDPAVLEDYEMLLQAGMAAYELFCELLDVPDAVRQTAALNDAPARRLLASFSETCQVVLRRRELLVAKDAHPQDIPPPPVSPLSPSSSAEPSTSPSTSPTAIAGPTVKLTKTKSGGVGGAGFLNGLSQSFQAMTANFRYKPEPLVSALCQSASRGDLQQVKGFVEQGANVDGRNEHKRTPLICAIAEQHAATARWLVEQAGANVRAKDGGSKGRPPLFHAAAAGSAELVALLHARGADVNERSSMGEPYFMGVVQGGNAAMVRMLLERGCDANTRDVLGRPVLIEALAAANLDLAAALLTHHADPNVREPLTTQTALHVAAAHQNPERVVDLVRLLLDHGADANARDGTGEPLVLAAAVKDRRELFRLLISRGADPNARDIYGRTMLQLLVRRRQQQQQQHNNSLDLVRALLEHGASPNQLLDSTTTGDGGETLLLHAVGARDRAFAALLLRHGADPNARDRDGRSPLMQALRGAQPDAGSNSGSGFDDPDAMVRLLVEHGANPNAEALCSPLDFAAAAGRAHVVQLLRSHGAVAAAAPDPLLSSSPSAASLVLSPAIGGGPSPGASPRPASAVAAAPRMTVEPEEELPPDYDSIEVRKSGPGVV
ncbi:hypothetical protein GGTG_02550 [Gaeumannomyces tritici R3-111a-1]|uniref:Uncharacterized protein n=1 Tax=Gaeumannomyces tritici (strain R3-111a-1) TaxID=644352 RepID=J3NMP4_GAET3|nr:hypothetical protein GGTG_02550 [Gaeumannomyces tritici R3-111a-1]EJT82577.1 hypothetical protein GGTG_02550 [Gaeumannomyces tritici R3-111a-1]